MPTLKTSDPFQPQLTLILHYVLHIERLVASLANAGTFSLSQFPGKVRLTPKGSGTCAVSSLGRDF